MFLQAVTQAYLVKENFPVLPMISWLLVWLPYHRAVGDSWKPALSKCFVTVGSMARVVGSKHQVPLPARGSLVRGKKLTEGGKIAHFGRAGKQGHWNAISK